MRRLLHDDNDVTTLTSRHRGVVTTATSYVATTTSTMTMTNRRHRCHDDVDVVRTTSTTTRLRLDIVVATSLQRSRQPSSVIWDVIVDDDDRRHRRRLSLDVRRCRLSLSVCRRSGNPSSRMRPRDYDVHVPACVSRPTLCPGVRLWLFIYDVCLGNFVTLVPSSLSRRDCSGEL